MAGYLEKRGKDTWRLVVSCGAGPDGKQARKRETFKGNKTEAKKALAKMIANIEAGQFSEGGKVTFKDFANKWLKEHADVNLSKQTAYRYREILESRIYDAIGHIYLNKLYPVHFVEFYNTLRQPGARKDTRSAGGLSETTILQHHRIINAILNTAVKWQLITSNPAARIDSPRARKDEAAFYNEEQIAALLQRAQGEELKYKLALYLALFSGARKGELLGLTWDCVNFDDNTIKINKSLQYVPGKGLHFKSPKTVKSNRTITLPASVMAMLSWHQAKQEREAKRLNNLWQDNNYNCVFTTWNGNPMHTNTLAKWFSNFIKENDLPPLPFHGLRHTAATMLINQGLPAKNISSRLGHATISTTFDIYGHALESTDREAANKLEKMIKNWG